MPIRIKENTRRTLLRGSRKDQERPGKTRKDQERPGKTRKDPYDRWYRYVSSRIHAV